MFCMKQDQLFDPPLALPDGFVYRHEFITPAEETDRIAAIRQLPLQEGAARWKWRHAISPTRELRYAITFRALARVWRGFSRPMGRISMLGVG